ncbi:carbohydrate-binding protein [Asanoa sp. NPDC049518]|uniref:fascin domain-containing protein n=1 Tax=unclassified Asanoa TaxID=2685164 RepID=UPI003438D526
MKVRSPIWRPTLRASVLLLVLTGGLVVAGPGPASAAPTDAAYNAGTGALNVDYANYLSKHDIVYNRPNTNPLHGLTVGNGRTGAMMWNQNGLTAQVSGVDLAEQSTYAAGNLNLFTSPQLDAGYTTFQQRLSLYDGTLTTRYDSNRTVTVLGAPNSEVMGIHVEDSRPGVTSIGLDLSLWDMNTVQNIADVPNLTTWRTVSTFADSTGVGLSRGQADPNNFGYTFAATVEGAAYTSQTVNGTRVRLNITPTSSYTIWFTAASRINSPSFNSVQQAKNQLAAVKATGYTSTLNAYKNWWHAFWAKSFVQYGGSADNDYLENAYYLFTYMIAAGGYGNYPVHFINGNFRATQDNSKWSNGYWYWNQRDVYNSFYSSNHTDLMRTFNNLYSRNYGAMKSYTQTRYGTDSLWVPETMGWDGNARGTINSDYVNDTYSTGTEAAYNMYLYYRYTNDTAYLQNVAYPFMRDAARFYQNRLSRNGAQYYMASSNAHETYWDVKNALTDLAAIRLLYPLTIQVSTQLGLDSGLRAGWQDVLNNLAPYQISNGAYLPHDPPSAQVRNGENVALELVWPYDQSGIGFPDQQTSVNTWNVRPFPYGNVWANDHVHAARLGLGPQAQAGMRTMLQKYQNYPNGMTNNTNGVYEYIGIHLAAMNESLMQSYNDKIRVFPAIPSDSGFVGKFTLLAKDGFLVSAEREAQETKYVGVRSLHGKQARVVNPWGTQQIRVRRTSDNAIITTVSAAEVTWATAANTSYVVERVAKPLTSYSATTLTGTANQGAKSLSGTASTFGLGPAGQGGLVNDTDLTYGANWYHTTARGYGDYNDDTHHSNTVGAEASYTFTGTGVEYLSERFSDMGNVDVYLDGTFQDNVNLNVSGARQAQQVVWSRTGLTSGQHTIRIVNKTTSVGMIDALRIITGGGSNPTGGTALRAGANNLYVTASGTTPLIASAGSIGGNERFDVVDLGGGNVALRSRANNQFVCAENAGANPLVANRPSAGSWETFARVNNADGTISLRATVNNKYVVAENGGAASLIANRDAIGPWEKFTLVAG